MSEFYLKDELYQSSNDISRFFIDKAADVVFYRDLIIPENQYHSPKLWKILGYDPDTKSHLSNELYLHLLPEDHGVLDAGIERVKEDSFSPFDKLLRFRHKRGHVIWMRCRLTILMDELDRPFRLLAVMNDVSQIKSLQVTIDEKDQEINRLALKVKASAVKDSLSGMYNRLMMDELLINEKDRSDRKRRIFSVIMLSIKNYDRMIQNFGVQTGDKIIKNIAERLDTILRKQDLKCLWSEHEIMVLLPETGALDVQDVRKKVLKDMNNWHLMIRGSKVHYSCAIGITTYKEKEPLEIVLRRVQDEMTR